jgi:beta-glucosidase
VPGTYTGNIVGVGLNIPALKMNDGPQGFRAMDRTGGDGTSTAWPSALTIAASWDTDLLYRWATAVAEEFAGKGANMALAPGIGIARVPTAGRNFEYLCGEDPILGAILVQPIVKGLQDNGIIADAKHYVNNEIESHRMLVSANVDERTRFELYYPPFQGAVDAGVLTVMCAYNRINDVYACNNEETLSHLRNVMGFKGWVVSDWTATKSTIGSLKAGMDMEMPYGIFYRAVNLEAKLAQGEITMEQIDRSVFRILNAMDKVGLFTRTPSGDPTANVTSEAHNQLAREIAAKSIVLLKNTNNLLPLQKESLGSCIAVFGDQSTVSGGGSGHVNPAYVISPAQGLTNALMGTDVKVLYNDGSDLNAASDMAKQCSVAVVVVATSSSEGSDRDNLSFGGNQDKLVSTIAAVNSNTVVIMNAPGAVLMPWINEVPAALMAFMPGQEAGNTFADVLFGFVICCRLNVEHTAPVYRYQRLPQVDQFLQE